jgi:hypothetical protein
MRLLFIMLIIAPLLSASCQGQISQLVPAVVGDGGGLVNVTISMSDGPGRAFVSVMPRTGITTQESIGQAAEYAFNLAGREMDCDVLVDFGGDGKTSFIDGPSAGTALTVMAYALLENKTIRQDTVITGTIEGNGNVGAVGGLYEKAKGAASNGAAFFITPVESFYETLLLRDVGKASGMTILQATDVEDVIGFMTENRTISQEGLAIEERGVPDIPDYVFKDPSSFRKVADRMIGKEESVIASMPEYDNDTAAVKRFFENETARQKGLIEKGYLFTAANEAFLDYIDISTIKAMLSGDVDLPRKKGEASICLEGLERPDLTDRNFQWVVGANLREGWARQKIDDANSTGKMLIEERYVEYNGLMYAQAWCVVAGGLVSAAPSGGQMIDEGAWKGLAADKLAQAQASAAGQGGFEDKLSVAQASYDDGRYGASIYDSVYVIENSGASDPESMEANASVLVGEDRDSLWGRIYQSHAAFLLAQNNTQVAYKTARFAKGLDEATILMVEAMRPATTGGAGGDDASGAGDGPWKGWWGTIDPASALIALVACISIFLFMLLIITLEKAKPWR